MAIDRAISIARIINKDSYAELWLLLAEKIKKDIYQNGWNDKVKLFTQFYRSDDHDASNLLMESNGFIDASDDKYKLTVKAIERELCEDGLLYRYKNKVEFQTTI